MGFFSGLAYWGKSLLKGVAWPVNRLRGEHSLGPVVRWTLHFVLLAAILVGLGLLNYWCGLNRLLRTPWPLVRMVWLPLIFLALYAAGWFAWWLTRLLRAAQPGSEWPDIDGAWTKATEAIERAGIDLQSVPVYLLLGRPAADMRCLFSSAQVPLSVPQTPRDPTAPLHAYANSEAVYIACSDTSLLGQQATLLAEYSAAQAALASTEDSAACSDAEELPPWSDNGSDHPVKSVDQDSVESLQTAVALLVKDESVSETAALPQAALPRRSLLEQAEVIERTSSRLEYLCTLIARDRKPYCPINGLMVLLPFSASDDELTAGETALLLERDLTTVRQTLEVRCGVITLICDLQNTPGGGELLARFPQGQRDRRLGVSFPLLAQCDSEKAPEMIRTGIQWTCNSLIPPLVYRLAQIRGGQNVPTADQLRLNSQLYHLAAEMRQLRFAAGTAIASSAVC